MLNVTSNIDKRERIARLAIGGILLIAAILGLGTWFFLLVGAGLVVEGVIGWCGIPIAAEKLGLLKDK
jgi:hypothetical protein